jgi:hypothetical protein
MKLTINKFFTAVLLPSLVFTSCKKGFLDVDPDMRTYINTPEKLGQLLSTAYPRNEYITFAETASDNAEDKGPGIGTNDALLTAYYNWQDWPGNERNSSTAYWNACYSAIAAANQGLQSIETENMGVEAIPYKGEALVARAYAHHMLSIFFAQPYKAETAGSVPGIPYVLTPEKTFIGKYTRGTVKSVYDNIEKDLTEGIKLIDDAKYSVPKYRFTRAAAHAFAARFYLFKKDWQKVVEHATAVVPGGDFTPKLRPWNTTYTQVGRDQYRIDFSKPENPSTLLLTSANSTYQRMINTYHYGMGLNGRNAYVPASNVTRKSLANTLVTYTDGVSSSTWKWIEFFFNTTPDTGFPYMQQILLSGDETLLNRAEAYAELGQYDLALRDLNTFYSTRVVNYSASTDAVTLEKINNFFGISDAKEGIITAILAAKKVEFLQEGLRWFDIVRRDITVTKKLYIGEEETTIELKAGAPRRLFQLPEEAKLAGLELNPR